MHREEVRHGVAQVAKSADGAGGARHPGGAEPQARRAPTPARRLQRELKGGSKGRAADALPAGATEHATPRSVRKGLISMLVAAAVLLVFNSGDLCSWARGLPGNAATDMLVEVADQWHEMMQRAGTATAMALVQDAVGELREQPWPNTDILAAGKADEF